MARPKSKDKRQAILDSAVAAFAQRGVWSTPTSFISREAGVADGTLFTYFATKEVLLNELYRALKRELAEALLSGYPEKAKTKVKFRHIWNAYVGWGAAHPAKFKVMNELRISDKITDESKAAGYEPIARLERMAADSIKQKILHNYPLDFIAAVMGGMAETTVAFMGGKRKDRIDFCAVGFELFWNGIVHE